MTQSTASKAINKINCRIFNPAVYWYRMKRTGLFILSLLLLLVACSGSNVYVDRNKKAIISRNGNPLQKVVVDGGGTEVTFLVYDKTKDNSVIYFNRHNPGFMVSEGFGLNKDYVLKLKAHAKYTVSCYSAAKDQAPSMINFRTDYNSNIVDQDDN